MGQADVNAGIGSHHRWSPSGPVRVWAMWSGKGTANIHTDTDFASETDARHACTAAASSEVDFRAALTTAQLAWYDGLPLQARKCVLADAASWHARGFCW